MRSFTTRSVVSRSSLAARSVRLQAFSTEQQVSVEMKEDFLRVTKNGEHADYHYFWLYHNCTSWLHPKTKECTVDVHEIPLDIKPRKVQFYEGVLHIDWAGQPRHSHSEYSLDFLDANNYGLNHREAVPPGSDSKNMIEIDYKDYEGTAEGDSRYAQDIVDRIDKFGAVVVRQRGTDTEAIIKDLLPEGEDVWESHFGRIEDLRTDNTTNKNTDQLGYTNIGISPHTDMPFVESPPSMQLLHSQQEADFGGDSYLVDARAAAYYLKATNPWAFDMLKTIPVKFHRKQKEFESVTQYPLIQCFGESIVQIRYSYFTMAPFRVPFEWMRLWYQAYSEFSKILHDERHQFRFLLRKGDLCLYSNLTMVHARESFQGARWIRGAYFDQNKVMGHLRGKIGQTKQ